MSSDPATSESPVVASRLNHFFGSGELRKQILEDIALEIRAGEIVIVTGPSGSGKSTLLTLIGALRSAQHGSLRVLGHEMCGAGPDVLQRARRQIGFIFQAHNLVGALTAQQNVEMSLQLGPRRSARDRRAAARAMLEAVGLGDRLHHLPAQLSGGQRQRVAIARALVAQPRIILADEPTASLDKASGREVVDRMQALARDQGVTVLLVTHDNRILDIADRIIQLEDGRLSSFTDAVIANSQHMMRLLAESHRKGTLRRVVADLDAEAFRDALETVTEQSRRFLESTSLADDEAFQSMLDEALFSFTDRTGTLLGAERASLSLVDEEHGELWLRFAHAEGGAPVELRFPLGKGVAGHVAATGEALRVDDAYTDPRFYGGIDDQTGFRTRSILCLPVRNHEGRVFAVAQLLNRTDGRPFDDADEARFADYLGSLGVILESWWALARRARRD